VVSDDVEPEYLTRSDIARILKISAKQAGRLMNRMPILRVGRTHRRVLRADFDAWRLKERKVPDQVIGGAAGNIAAPSSGSVFRAAEAMKKGRRLPRA
jgi:hypothetical protein